MRFTSVDGAGSRADGAAAAEPMGWLRACVRVCVCVWLRPECVRVLLLLLLLSIVVAIVVLGCRFDYDQ